MIITWGRHCTFALNSCNSPVLCGYLCGAACDRYREDKMLSVFVNLFAAIAYVSCRPNRLHIKMPSTRTNRCHLVEAVLSSFSRVDAGFRQWARICSHANGDVGPAAQVNVYKYLDYLLTCPLLVSKTTRKWQTASRNLTGVVPDRHWISCGR